MTVVVVGNEKGGCGKTTIAVNLAAFAASLGASTLLIDADPGQQSASKWWARRQDHETLPAITLISATEQDMGDLPGMCEGFSVVVIDTGAMDSRELRLAAMNANLLIVPVQPDELDLWTLPTMERLYTRARQENNDLQAVIVLNRVPYQAARGDAKRGLFADTAAWITENVPGLKDAPMMPLIGRAAYGRASGSGLGVTESLPFFLEDPKAKRELTDLYLKAMAYGKNRRAIQSRHPVRQRERA